VQPASCALLSRGKRGGGAYAFVQDPDGYEVELFAD
jgi:hypothetical protein